ncbi:hypothetical protein Zmor_011051 [Zophobas morio]|uniref:Uncharacterized protein n=1 Tax=Zophobas morio TaxID=2755281 RepID=A0AA38MK40_9CUCU|nr:hypothetical protein Zmor_011051 [Zophobas morio]
MQLNILLIINLHIRIKDAHSSTRDLNLKCNAYISKIPDKGISQTDFRDNQFIIKFPQCRAINKIIRKIISKTNTRISTKIRIREIFKEMYSHQIRMRDTIFQDQLQWKHKQ